MGHAGVAHQSALRRVSGRSLAGPVRAGRGPGPSPLQVPVRSQFSGHETFALRAGWPKKAFDAAADDPKVFGSKGAIARFGVGKNMVRSIRHWAYATGVLQEAGRGVVEAGPLGRQLLDPDTGLDPYLEDAAAPWVLHWWLCREPAPATLWHFVFGVWTGTVLEDEILKAALETWLDRRGETLPADSTLKRDRQTLVNCYLAPRGSRDDLDDRLGSPLTDLGFITRDASGTPVLQRGAAHGLPPWVFAHAVLNFWHRRAPGRDTLAFSDVVHADASPGRVFGLGEEAAFALVDRLERSGDHPFSFRDSAGIRQLFRVRHGFTAADALAAHYEHSLVPA